MSDDASYSSFLDKANQDTGVNSGPKSAQAPNPKSYSSSNVPPALQNVKATYISDTDSPFEAVSFDYDGTELPSAQEFEKLVARESKDNGLARVEELTVKDFDPRGEYDDLVKKVEGVVEHKKVKVYRVGRGKTRVEYFVVGLAGGKEGGRILGMEEYRKALLRFLRLVGGPMDLWWLYENIWAGKRRRRARRKQ